MDVIPPRIPARNSLSNFDVVADLERKIDQLTGGRIRDLRLEEVGDSLILCGRTSTYYIKQLASQVALDEKQSRAFHNSIEVV